MIELSTKDVADDLNVLNIIDYELMAKDISEMAHLAALKTLVNILLPLRASETLSKLYDQFKDDYADKLKVRIASIDSNEDEKINEQEKKPIFNTRIMRT